MKENIKFWTWIIAAPVVIAGCFAENVVMIVVPLIIGAAIEIALGNYETSH